MPHVEQTWPTPPEHLGMVPVYNGCPCWSYLVFRVYSRCSLFDFDYVFFIFFLHFLEVVCLSIFYDDFAS